MIAPVSVCHQVSWIGFPSASSPQATTSGFSGSPTLAMWRRLDSSRPASGSAPAFMSIRSAVGAVYQTLTRSCSRIEYQRTASNSASSTMQVTPQASGETRPYDVPVTQPGSAVHQNTSPSRRSSANRPVASWATTASCTCTAPLGIPVVPLVKWTNAGSSAPVGAIEYSVDARAMSRASA